MTAQTKQAKEFYQKLQKKFSRRINLDRSRIFLALEKFNINPNKDLPGKVIQIIGNIHSKILFWKSFNHNSLLFKNLINKWNHTWIVCYQMMDIFSFE